jgi:hypothetical protein
MDLRAGRSPDGTTSLCGQLDARAPHSASAFELARGDWAAGRREIGAIDLPQGPLSASSGGTHPLAPRRGRSLLAPVPLPHLQLPGKPSKHFGNSGLEVEYERRLRVHTRIKHVVGGAGQVRRTVPRPLYDQKRACGQAQLVVEFEKRRQHTAINTPRFLRVDISKSEEESSPDCIHAPTRTTGDALDTLSIPRTYGLVR